jgi:hypothetical protein
VRTKTQKWRKIMATLTPLYGTDYKNRKEAVAAFEADECFIFSSFFHAYRGYCTKSTLIQMGIESVDILYKDRTKSTTVKVEQPLNELHEVAQ